VRSRMSLAVFVASIAMIGVAAQPAAAATGAARSSTATGGRGEDLRTWHRYWDVNFDGGVPVGGWVDITVNSDGTYHYQGHMHDSGFTSYDFTDVWALKPLTGGGPAAGFGASGHMAGTAEPGSRDFDWNQNGTDLAVISAFRTGFTPSGKAAASLDIGGILSALGLVAGGVDWIVSIF
jgi:hypothetical protein